MSSTADRFIFVAGELARAEDAISNEDPMRFSKRVAINAARAALANGIDRAFEILNVVSAINHDQVTQ